VDVTIQALASGFPLNWGVELVLNGDEMTAVQDYNPPHEWQTSLPIAEHTATVYMIDENGVRQTQHSDAVAFGIGDYYVAYGDSITGGVGDDDPSDNTSADGRNTSVGFTPILNDLLTNHFMYPHTIKNEGVADQSGAGGLSKLDDMLARHPRARRILVLFGTNDSASSMPTPSGVGLESGAAGYNESYKDNMQQIISAIINAGKVPILAYVPIRFGSSSNGPSYDDPDNHPQNDLIQEYNQVIDELIIANPEIDLSPPNFYEYYRTTPRENKLSVEFDDNLHPNGEGYRSMADLWFQELTQ